MAAGRQEGGRSWKTSLWKGKTRAGPMRNGLYFIEKGKTIGVSDGTEVRMIMRIKEAKE